MFKFNKKKEVIKDEFKNDVINGIHISRYIASWCNAGGDLTRRKDLAKFKGWLRHLGLSDDQVTAVTILATNGKLELETDAKIWIETNDKMEKEIKDRMKF